MIRRTVRYALPLLLVCFFCPGAISRVHAQHAIVVSGVVRWSESRKPAAGVMVTAYRAAGKTSESLIETQTLVNGSFVLRLPSPGRYRIAASVGRAPLEAFHTLSAPAHGVMGFTLLLSERFRRSALPGDSYGPWDTVPAMHLEVYDAAGKPVRRGMVQVWVVWAPNQPAPRDEDGMPITAGIWSLFHANRGVMEINTPQFFYRQIPARVGISVRSALFGTAQLILDRWPDAPITIRLHPAPRLTGTVLDQDGEPVRDAEIRVTGMSRELPFRFLQGWAWGASGETGHFDIPSLFSGRYGVQVRLFNSQTGPPNYVTIPSATVPHPTIPNAKTLSMRGESSGSAAGVRITLHLVPRPFSSEPPLYAFGLQEAQPTLRGLTPMQPRGEGAIEDREAVFGLSALERYPAPAPIRIAGRVREDPTGSPLANCGVRLYHGADYYPLDAGATAADGTFSLSAPKSGHYRLVFDQSKYVPKEYPIDVIETQTKPLVITVRPRPDARILVEGADGRPLKDVPVRVWLHAPQGSVISSFGSADGLPLKVEWLAAAAPVPGDLIEFGAWSNAFGVASVEMTRWPTAPVVLRLAPGLKLHCLVLDAAGKPLPHATVGLDLQIGGAKGRWEPVPEESSEQTDLTGAAEFRHLLPGDITIQISVGDRPLLKRRVTLTAPDTTVTLEPDPIPPVR
ncbi:MAG TPA: carboxypeptidase regulatory-like domain-containing protein [Armatimonadota bacterium]|nr:carboxypeptidase regulatory-like domain-containing protein [Armatimonadota bacterium]